MNDKINGRTPEEIKKGMECCAPRYESKHWVSCSSECPFRNEGAYCRNVLNKCVKMYIQQLERERDAAVADMTELMQLAQFCRHCKHLTEDGECTFDFAANKWVPWNCWQWRGVQEVE